MTYIRTPVKKRYLTPTQYLDDIKRNQVTNNIANVKFIPPQIGQGGFGKFLVEYKMPVLVSSR